MKEIVFATNNSHKLDELRAIAGDGVRVISLAELGCHDDIPEDGETLTDNALAKARWVHERYGVACLADDTGLEVDALEGAPGVHTARYAGPGHDAAANVELLLHNLNGVEPDRRTARFRTVMAYIAKDGTERTFDGVVEGVITGERRGTDGFGYDPVFRPAGWTGTFAEAGPDAKNAVSHRGRAARAFLQFFEQQ